jgi:hypothetical protein
VRSGPSTDVSARANSTFTVVTLCRLFYLYFPRASILRANPPQTVPFIYDDAVPLPEANLFLPVVCLVAPCVSPECLTAVHCLQMRKKRI